MAMEQLNAGVNVFDFMDKILEKTIYFKVIRLSESFFVWIGLESKLSNMALAMPAKYGNVPSSCNLFGSKAEMHSCNLAQKLAKRFSQQVFVSCSVPFEQQLSLSIEKRLCEELDKLLGHNASAL